jgi:hypothetical protein
MQAVSRSQAQVWCRYPASDAVIDAVEALEGPCDELFRMQLAARVERDVSMDLRLSGGALVQSVSRSVGRSAGQSGSWPLQPAGQFFPC